VCVCVCVLFDAFCIPQHVPELNSLDLSCMRAVELLPAALELPPEDFFSQHKFPKPCPSDNLILYSRGPGLRASWAAQVCIDAGLER
jgi:hypothetical protein